MSEKDLNSAIYEGTVMHSRFYPILHRFSYKVFMMFIDLSESEGLFSSSWFWSFGKFNLACFLRKDYLGKSEIPLDEEVRNKVESETGIRPKGRICVLTNFRYLSYIINPITCYYCYDENDELQFLVAEVTNTPWGQRHSYVLANTNKEGEILETFAKDHHVSPFMPMEMTYFWRSDKPSERLKVSIETTTKDNKKFIASLLLKRKEISSKNLRSVLFRYPFMTGKVALGIYWQAFRLWLKKVPFYSNPTVVSNNDKKVLKKVKGVKL